MTYQIEFKPQAYKDLKRIPVQDQKRIIGRIEDLSDNLKGDVKRLSNYTYEYRLRVGNYRVLFEIEKTIIIIYHIKHRREAYL